MSIEIMVAKEKDAKYWDQLVDTSPHATIFHTWKWLKIIEKQTKSKLYPLVGLMGTTPKGIFPLFQKKNKFINFLFSPPPKALLLYLGPVIVDYSNLKQSKKETIFIEFLKCVNEFVRKKIKFNYIRIRSPPGLLDSRPFIWSGYKVSPLYTYMIDLTKGLENVWNGFNSQVRIDIKKTIKMGVTVHEGSKRDLEFLRKSVAERFNEQGVKRPTSYKKYLSDIYKEFYPNNFKIFIAKYKGKNVGGLTLLSYKKKASLWMGIPKTNIKGICPNDLATWRSINWAHENGHEKYEIMDAGNDPRLRSFKSKFNPNLIPWFLAVKHSSTFFELSEKITKKVYSTFRLGAII